MTPIGRRDWLTGWKPSERLRVEDVEQPVTHTIVLTPLSKSGCSINTIATISIVIGRPLPVVLVRLNDRDATRLHRSKPRVSSAVSARNWVPAGCITGFTRWTSRGSIGIDPCGTS
jgi:hypothetical protein